MPTNPRRRLQQWAGACAIVFIISAGSAVYIIDRVVGGSIDLPGGTGTWMTAAITIALVTGPVTLVLIVLGLRPPPPR